MGEKLSPSQPNPTSSPTAMSSSKSSPPHQVNRKSEPTSIRENCDAPTDTRNTAETPGNLEENSIVSDRESEETIKEGHGDEEEEEGECGFCLFMKAGGCKDTFVEWEKCVEEGEKNKEDIVDKCFQVTTALKECMVAHSDYYAPILQAEKAAEAEAMEQLEEEKAGSQEGDGEDSGTKGKEEALNGSELKD